MKLSRPSGQNMVLHAAGCLMALAMALLMMACGGSPPSQKPATSMIAQRVFVSNKQTSVLQIIDAKKDTLATQTIPVGLSPTLMVDDPMKQTTAVFNAGNNTVSIVNNTTESQAQSFTLPDFTESMAISPDDKLTYVAVRNAAAVEVLNFSTQTISNKIAVPGVRRLVLSHNGSRLLAFSDSSNSVFVIDTTNLSAPATPVGSFDHPVNAVFRSDDSTAYILSCGPECGGTAAAVTALGLASNAVGASVSVPAATVGLLDSSGNLYVAGNATASLTGGSGMLSVISAASLTLSKSGIAITDGIHNLMALGANGRLFIGSQACNSLTAGCLSIYNVSSGAVTTDPPRGDVTGIEPIPGRNVVYVCEGGELRIYDTTTDALQATQVDIIGNAVDLREVF